MKKIIAFLTALIISVTVMASSFKANAVILEASVIAELISICSSFLIGSGAYTQSQINDMSTTDILNNTQSVGLSFDWGVNAKQKAEFISNFNSFINNSIKKQGEDIGSLLSDGGLSNLVAEKYVDMVYGSVAELPTVNPELKGYGAFCYVEDVFDGSKMWFYGSNGIIYDSGTASIYGDIFKLYDFRGRGDIVEESYTGSLQCYNGHERYSVKFIGDWTYEDGTPATDMLTFVQEVPEAIGTVNVDGEDLAVNGDGTVIKDGVTYVINDDGSVTIGDTTYYPDYDLSVYPTTTIINLIGDISDNIDVKEDTDEKELIDDITIDVPIEIADSAFSSLTLPKTIATVFPFCIPVDFYNGIKLLSEEPEAPKFEIPFEIPQYKSFPGFKKMIVIDFSEYSTAFAIVRWGFFAIFMFGLCFVTFKIVKGA